MALSNAVKAALLDAYFGDTPPTVPATLHVGLSSTTPAEDGTNVTEPSSGGYARVALDNTDGGDGTDWNDATVADPSVKDNANAITFPQSTGPWLAGADLTHAALFDAATGGTFIGFVPLNTVRAVDAEGITLEFAAGELNIEIN